KMPPRPWAQFDVQKVNTAASMGFARYDDEMYFIIIAEKLPEEMTAEGMFAIWKSRLVSRDADAVVPEPKPIKLLGLDALEAHAQVKVAKAELGYVNLIMASHGFLYQLLGWAEKSKAERVQQEV